MAFLKISAVLALALFAAHCEAVTMRGGAVRSLRSMSQVPCTTEVKYKVVNECDWNSKRHPTDYPSNAHWSPFCGTTHTAEKSIYATGETATDGIKLVAETGDCSILESEVASCEEKGYCGDFLKYKCDAFDGTCTHTGYFSPTKKYSYLTLVSMVAPSPDWMVGVESFGLCKDGYWVPKYEKYLNGIDAGTDDGSTFAANDLAAPERRPISGEEFAAEDASNIFYNPEKMKLYPLCKVTITLDA